MEEILLTMGLMLLFAKLTGRLFERLGIVSIVGEILAGIILGPLLGWVLIGDFLSGFMTLGIIILLFMAGMEVRFEDIRDNTYRASFLAAAGGLFSFIFVFLVGMIFFNNFIIAVAMGTVVISTSNGALFLLLMKSGKFNTKIGKFMVATSIADDVVGIMALAFFKMYLNSSISFFNLFFILLVSLGFYLFALTAGSKAVTRIINKLHMFNDENMLFAVPVAIVFLLAFITDQLGLSIAAGAFLAGMTISNSHFAGPVIVPKVETLARGLLLPLLYASIGTLLVFSELNMLLIGLVVAAAMLGKFIGCGMMSGLLGFKLEEMKLIGIAMMPRADDNIAILQLIAMSALAGITSGIYTSMVFAIILTTILSPILIRLFIKL